MGSLGTAEVLQKSFTLQFTNCDEEAGVAHRLFLNRLTHCDIDFKTLEATLQGLGLPQGLLPWHGGHLALEDALW